MSVFLKSKTWQIQAGRKSGRIALLSAFPNAFLPSAGETLSIKGMDEAIVKVAVNSGVQVVSFVGHSSTANLFSSRLGMEVSVFRGEATLDDLILIGSFSPPRRLAEGETWDEGEILSMPIKWLMIS